MSLTPYYRQVSACIAGHQFDQLRDLPLTQPDRFNWVADVLEAIHQTDRPDGDALVWTDGGQEVRYSFADVLRLSNQLLNYWRQAGVAPGDPVFLLLPLLPENWLAYVAAIKGGQLIIPAATILAPADIAFRFGKLLPRVVITDADNAPKIDEAETQLGQTVPLKLLVGGPRDGWQSFGAVAAQATTAEAADTRPDDPLFLFFTSGTTGLPKVVTHTHLSYPLGHLTTASWIGLRAGDMHYNIAQPGWAKWAWSSFFAAWSVGATVFAYQPPARFDAKQQLRMMERYGVTTFCAPPTALRMLILEDLTTYRFALRECVAAGEPLNPEIIEAWRAGTGLTIRDGYGQTESTALVANLPGARLKFGSMGKPTFLYDIVIADDEGRPRPDTDEGHIAVRTSTGRPNGLFTDYFGDPDKRNDVFRHGLYYTGDKAYRDADGYIWFVGRDDDVIKASDYRVGPFEVESVLMEHEAVVESAVIGSPHPIRGYVVKAFVRLRADYAPGEEVARAIYAHARQHVAPYKVPRLIEFVDELPKTISGKIRRVELRAAEAERKARSESSAREFRFGFD